MMDYLGDMPAPSKESIMKEIGLDIYNRDKQENVCSPKKNTMKFEDKKRLKKIEERVGEEVDMFGISNLGSYAGYITFTRKSILNNTIDSIRKRPIYVRCMRLKTLVRVIIAWNRLMYCIIHERYKPEGVEYNSIIGKLKKESNKLPKIGNKKLETPISNPLFCDCLNR
tara:strand:+ start:16 stop:522 length:507 start_codon:yes stop_codon:yes gene_type:complete